MAGTMVYRLPVGGAGAAHMRTYIQAMAAAEVLSDNRGYNHIAGFHGTPNWWCWHHQINRRTPLQARLFLPWHRAYLLWLELALQDRVAGATIPWWDWTTVRRVPPAYTARTKNPLLSTKAFVPTATPPLNRRTRRAPGRNPFARLPTPAELIAVLNDPDWSSFSDGLEDLHDSVHGWVGGDMGDPTTAAFDPVFFAHHCMIDRVWSLWQVKHGNGTVPGELLPLQLPPFGKRFADVLDTQALGYEYAASAAVIPIGGGH
jgi:tyrosinase